MLTHEEAEDILADLPVKNLPGLSKDLQKHIQGLKNIGHKFEVESEQLELGEVKK